MQTRKDCSAKSKAILLRVQRGLLCDQFCDQFFGPVNRDLIRDGPLYPAIPLNVLVDLYALLAHEQFRIRAWSGQS
jgi:hypothetical protein